jgi:hypothetical protein
LSRKRLKEEEEGGRARVGEDDVHDLVVSSVMDDCFSMRIWMVIRNVQ